ncbi:MAG: bifunctional nuclease family protein [Chloroflexi bacterium]|nr:MAG: bifunctional nuclease family protein [Chloroflexota bacterium]RLC97420.1 MAG: bifunctional nuclease family protein [Chloroflexota bacterium]
MVEMSIDSIRVSVVNSQRVVILKETNADRYLPIWIGPAEADAIAIKLQDVTVPRPLTHDLLCSMVSILGARVNFVVVNDLQNDTFYARISVTIDGKDLEVDSRPSDAIALAVRAEVPIYAEEDVLDRAGIVFDQETGKPIPSSQVSKSGEHKEVTEEELRKLSAFAEFVNTLDLHDLGKGKGEDENA